MLKRILVAVVALGVVVAAVAVRGVGQRVERQRRAHRARVVPDELQAAWKRKDWAQVTRLGAELAALEPGNPGPWYDAACGHAHLGETEAALAALERAAREGCTWSHFVSQSDDLASLRAEPRFQAAVEAMRRNARELPPEPAPPLDGVKTVAGFAEDGTHFRLRMSPDASPEKPQRLLVWLHGSGGSHTELIEQHAADLAARGWATLVVTSKWTWEYWDTPSFRALLERTVPEAGRTPGIDASRPVLVGFSAGGQQLLVSWSGDPPLPVAGLVLDAAYPFDVGPPDDPEKRRIPMFVLMGEARGLELWDAVRPQWTDAGVPLTVSYVEGGGHAWLLDETRFGELSEWLSRL